jgi:hypothetical protein
VPEVVVAKRREEQPLAARQPSQLNRGDRRPARGLGPHATGVDDLARVRHTRDLGELHPLDVTDRGDAHEGAAR